MYFVMRTFAIRQKRHLLPSRIGLKPGNTATGGRVLRCLLVRAEGAEAATLTLVHLRRLRSIR